MNPLRTPKDGGTSLQKAWLYRRNLQDRLLHLMGSYGYQVLEMPILAPADLFLRKSGGELASQMFSFLDPGSNSVSLRPEFTAPIMAHYLEVARPEGIPSRWQYSGPVFRYDGRSTASRGQFTQVGAELIGVGGVLADAELVTLAADVIFGLGITGYRVKLADLDVLHSLLDTVGISDRARTFIIANVPALQDGTQDSASLLERAQNLHLAGAGPEDLNLSAAIHGLDDAQAREVLHGFLNWSGGESPQLGQRNPEEVVQRLLRKLRGSDDRESLERGFKLAADLAGIQQAPASAIQGARRVLQQAGANLAALDRFGTLVDLLESQSPLSGSLVVDFGLARSIGYYNGIIFEVTHPDCSGSLGGGGRYDALARALGGPEPVPALGFAYNMDTLVELTPANLAGGGAGASSKNGLLQWPSSALVLPEGASSHDHALAAAQELRQSGMLVELEVSGLNLSDAISHAVENGLTQVVVVGHDGQRTLHQVE